MNTARAFAILVSSLLPVVPTLAQETTSFPKVTVRGSELYAGDEKLRLLSVGYDHCRPGQDPESPMAYQGYGYDLVDSDMAKIKAAGFNSIRTWHLIDPKLVELAAKHGLWMVGGIWTQTKINVADEAATEQANRLVANLAKSYAKYPNVAMLLILNEPDMGTLLKQDPAKVKAYFDRLANTARENCPGVPVSFSNWPNAAFIDPASWDVISYNLYPWSKQKFLSPMGYRGYVDGMRRHATGGKPMYVSEYGYWTPAPKLDVRDAWNMTYVPDEATQSKLTLRDREVLAQLPLVGGAILSWNDNWWLSRDYSSPSLPKPAGYETKAVHEPNECVEWAGIMSLDTDLRGTPRQACLDLTKANQILLESPDGGRINAALPVSAYLNEAVDEVEVWIDGEKRGRFDKTSPHWVEKTFRAPGRDIAKHALEVRAFDSDGKLLGSASRTVWTARNTALPTLVITSRKDEANRVWFTFDARDDRGRPLAGQKIQWGALDAVTWIDQNGELTTDENGRCELKRPMPANYIQISGGFDYARGDFKTRITDLAFYRQR